MPPSRRVVTTFELGRIFSRRRIGFSFRILKHARGSERGVNFLPTRPSWTCFPRTGVTIAVGTTRRATHPRLLSRPVRHAAFRRSAHGRASCEGEGKPDCARRRVPMQPGLALWHRSAAGSGLRAGDCSCRCGCHPPGEQGRLGEFLLAMCLLSLRRRLRRLSKLLKTWSGRRDSNPRPQPWQGLSPVYARASLFIQETSKPLLYKAFYCHLSTPSYPIHSR